MVVKMAAAVAAAALLLLCRSVTGDEGCNSHAPTNGNFTLPLNFQVKPSDTLKWFRDNKNIYRRSGEYLFDNDKMTRVTANGSLEFVGINNNDKGLYKAEVIRDGNAIHTQQAKVCLMDPVTTPNLTMECLKTMVKFTCKVEQSKSPIQITWMQNDKKLKTEKAKSLTRTVKLVLEDEFRCTSSNAVSSQTSKPLTQNCVTYLFGQENWIMMIILGGGGGLVLVLIVIVIVCCCRTRRKKSMKVKDEEELRLGWTNTQQQAQQQQHQHHSHGQCHHPPSNRHQPHRQQQQQQPPGNTGPRQHRSKQPRDPQRDGQPQLPRPRGQPRPSPRGPPQRKAADDEEQPPPLPQPRRITNVRGDGQL